MRALIFAAALLGACAAPSPQQAQAPAIPPPDSPLMHATPGLDASPEMAAQVAAWNQPFPPFTIIGNVHYVGDAGVSSFLITTPEGHFLLDGGLAESAPHILANIRTLGFDPGDVRALMNSHAHFDHSGGLAALKAATGARFYASEADREELESGHTPYGPAAAIDAAPVPVDHVVSDGEGVTLGGVTMTALIMPGHTQGCTSWLLDVRDSAGRPHRAIFHCSSSVGGQSLAPESYPGQVADYRATFARVGSGAVSADIFLANHPEFFDLAAKRARQQAGEANAFVDAAGLQTFNTRMQQAFEAELARQQAAR